MKWSEQAMRECFYMSNICPQDPQLNRGSWATLEKACRRWAKAEGSVYIVCGPVFQSGRKRRTIGRDHTISVPDGFYKVVLSLRKGHEKGHRLLLPQLLGPPEHGGGRPHRGRD